MMISNDPSQRLAGLFVEESCLDLDYCREILARASSLPVRVIKDQATPPLELPPLPRGFDQGKRYLLLARNRGAFLKPCPGTREYQCCGYQVLNIGAGCPMDCVYCILQAYLNTPWLSLYVNIDDLLAELDAVLTAEPHRLFRIGTGEFTDSMALDRLSGLSRILINHLAGKDNAVLELKSKAVMLDHLEAAPGNHRVIMAWSLNSPQVMRRYELHTAPLAARLAAASRCAELGFRLAFHFDPVILHPGWQEGYQQTIDQLFAAVPAERIAWISLGAFRFLPALRPLVMSRFPAAGLIHQEFVPGLDNKFRYFRSQRVELYRHLLAALRKPAADSTCIYLCMESDTVWQEVFGYTPADRGGLAAMLDRAAGLA